MFNNTIHAMPHMAVVVVVTERTVTHEPLAGDMGTNTSSGYEVERIPALVAIVAGVVMLLVVVVPVLEYPVLAVRYRCPEGSLSSVA